MSRLNHWIFGLVVVTGLMGICGDPGSDDLQSYTWESVAFQAPVAFSGPEELGLGTVVFTHPPSATPAQAQFEITLTLIDAQQVEAMGMDDAGLLTYVKSTYHATAKPAEGHIEREIDGQPVQGETVNKSIPKKSRLELYLIPRSDGSKLVLAFTVDDGMPKDQAEEIAGIVASTLRVR